MLSSPNPSPRSALPAGRGCRSESSLSCSTRPVSASCSSSTPASASLRDFVGAPFNTRFHFRRAVFSRFHLLLVIVLCCGFPLIKVKINTSSAEKNLNKLNANNPIIKAPLKLKGKKKKRMHNILRPTFSLYGQLHCRIIGIYDPSEFLFVINFCKHGIYFLE